MGNIMRNQYNILLKDVGNTFNINMHSFSCFAASMEEAIGMMFIKRKDLNPDDIRRISMYDFINPRKTVYESA